MNTEWLTAESFELTHAVISAINRLSIHAKLTLAGNLEQSSELSLKEARGTLRSFLDRLESIVREVERDQEGPILGADPRMGLLAQRYVSAKRHSRPRSPLYDLSLEEVKSLLDATTMPEQRQLIDCLRGLRSLVEEHAHTDVVGILGEL